MVSMYVLELFQRRDYQLYSRTPTAEDSYTCDNRMLRLGRYEIEWPATCFRRSSVETACY